MNELWIKFIEDDQSLTENEMDQLSSNFDKVDDDFIEVVDSIYLNELLSKHFSKERRNFTARVQEKIRTSKANGSSELTLEKVKRKSVGRNTIPRSSGKMLVASLLVAALLLIALLGNFLLNQRKSESDGSTKSSLTDKNFFIQSIEGDVYLVENLETIKLPENYVLKQNDILMTGENGVVRFKLNKESSGLKLEPNSELQVIDLNKNTFSLKSGSLKGALKLKANKKVVLLSGNSVLESSDAQFLFRVNREQQQNVTSEVDVLEGNVVFEDKVNHKVVLIEKGFYGFTSSIAKLKKHKFPKIKTKINPQDTTSRFYKPHLFGVKGKDSFDQDGVVTMNGGLFKINFLTKNWVGPVMLSYSLKYRIKKGDKAPQVGGFWNNYKKNRVSHLSSKSQLVNDKWYFYQMYIYEKYVMCFVKHTDKDGKVGSRLLWCEEYRKHSEDLFNFIVSGNIDARDFKLQEIKLRNMPRIKKLIASMNDISKNPLKVQRENPHLNIKQFR